MSQFAIWNDSMHVLYDYNYNSEAYTADTAIAPFFFFISQRYQVFVSRRAAERNEDYNYLLYPVIQSIRLRHRRRLRCRHRKRQRRSCIS